MQLLTYLGLYPRGRELSTDLHDWISWWAPAKPGVKIRGVTTVELQGDHEFDRTVECGHDDHMGQPTVVGARELKTRLGGYLRQVRLGRTLVITDRGEPVAELKPLQPVAGEDATLQRLKALGAVTRLENRPLAPFRPERRRGPSVSDAIVEDRNDRA